jgi:hypothetical protein
MISKAVDANKYMHQSFVSHVFSQVWNFKKEDENKCILLGKWKRKRVGKEDKRR